MKKIAFFMNNLYGGGAEKVLQTILNNFDFNNREVTLYAFSQAELDRNIYNSQVNYKSIFGTSTGIIKKIKGYIFSHLSPKLSYKLLIKDDYDIVIAFTEGEVTKLVSGAPEKCKKIAWVHTDMIKNPWTEFLFSSVESESECYKKFNKVFCVSEDVKSAFLRKYNIDAQKVRLLQNPIDGTQIIKKSTQKEELNPIFRPLLVTIGRLEEQKGYIRLVNALAKLKQYNYEMWILGDGSQREILERIIQENSLSEKVKLLGFVSNPYKYLIQADAFVCSSYAEGFSTVATEAIILSKPVLTTRVAGMEELFAGNECGVIVENSDEALLSMLKNLLEGNYNLEMFKKNAQLRAKAFNLSELMNTFYKAIEE